MCQWVGNRNPWKGYWIDLSPSTTSTKFGVWGRAIKSLHFKLQPTGWSSAKNVIKEHLRTHWLGIVQIRCGTLRPCHLTERGLGTRVTTHKLHLCLNVSRIAPTITFEHFEFVLRSVSPNLTNRWVFLHRLRGQRTYCTLPYFRNGKLHRRILIQLLG